MYNYNVFKTVPFLFRDIARISRDLWRCIYDSPKIKMDLRQVVGTQYYRLSFTNENGFNHARNFLARNNYFKLLEKVCSIPFRKLTFT